MSSARSPSVSPSAIDLQALLREPPSLIGREAELSTAADILAQRAPALIVVAGDTGLGKSAFLREIGARAVADGWSVAGSDETGRLTVTPGTTPAVFERRVREALGLSGSEGVEASRHVADGVRGRTESTDGRGGDITQALFVKSTRDGSSRPADAAWPGLTELMRDLEAHAPILLLIDGYCPSEAFGRTFTNAFRRSLMHSGESLVVIMGEREELLIDVMAVASTVIPFGALDHSHIHEHLEQLSHGLSQPVSEAELERYAHAAARRPEIIGSLSRLLSIDRAAAQ